MKKSNKISVFYFLSSVFLLVVLIFGGVYGIYVSVGLNFVRGNAVNSAGVVGGASNVSFGGSVNFESSMSGIIILSIVLIVLGVFDIVVLFKQLVFFKQFKTVKDSSLEQVIERKIKSKKSVVVFVFILDLLSVAAGVVGVILNARTFPRMNNIWLLYVVDLLVVLFAVVSFVLLIIKLKRLKQNEMKVNFESDKTKQYNRFNLKEDENVSEDFDIDKLEYLLLKLKYLKTNKFISADEFECLRKKVVSVNDDFVKEKNKAD